MNTPYKTSPEDMVALDALVRAVMRDMPGVVLGALVGEAMKRTKGAWNPYQLLAAFNAAKEDTGRQPQAILRFADGKIGIIHEQYFPGWPQRIMAHGLEGSAYVGRPQKRAFQRVEDEVIWPPLPSEWHGQKWPSYREVTDSTQSKDR